MNNIMKELKNVKQGNKHEREREENKRKRERRTYFNEHFFYLANLTEIRGDKQTDRQTNRNR